MGEWSFSESAELAVAIMLVATIVAAMLVG
jgi:hypothetical protein